MGVYPQGLDEDVSNACTAPSTASGDSGQWTSRYQSLLYPKEDEKKVIEEVETAAAADQQDETTDVAFLLNEFCTVADHVYRSLSDEDRQVAEGSLQAAGFDHDTATRADSEKGLTMLSKLTIGISHLMERICEKQRFEGQSGANHGSKQLMMKEVFRTNTTMARGCDEEMERIKQSIDRCYALLRRTFRNVADLGYGKTQDSFLDEDERFKVTKLLDALVLKDDSGREGEKNLFLHDRSLRYAKRLIRQLKRQQRYASSEQWYKEHMLRCVLKENELLGRLLKDEHTKLRNFATQRTLTAGLATVKWADQPVEAMAAVLKAFRAVQEAMNNDMAQQQRYNDKLQKEFVRQDERAIGFIGKLENERNHVRELKTLSNRRLVNTERELRRTAEEKEQIEQMNFDYKTRTQERLNRIQRTGDDVFVANHNSEATALDPSLDLGAQERRLKKKLKALLTEQQSLRSASRATVAELLEEEQRINGKGALLPTKICTKLRQLRSAVMERQSLQEKQQEIDEIDTDRRIEELLTIAEFEYDVTKKREDLRQLEEIVAKERQKLMNMNRLLWEKRDLGISVEDEIYRAISDYEARDVERIKLANEIKAKYKVLNDLQQVTVVEIQS